MNSDSIQMEPTPRGAYWMNNGFSANVVNDVPNESRLEPPEWGAATVE